MSIDLSMFEGSLNPKHIFETLGYRKKFIKEHPDYFAPERSSCILWKSRFR